MTIYPKSRMRQYRRLIKAGDCPVRETFKKKKKHNKPKKKKITPKQKQTQNKQINKQKTKAQTKR